MGATLDSPSWHTFEKSSADKSIEAIDPLEAFVGSEDWVWPFNDRKEAADLAEPDNDRDEAERAPD